LSGFIFAAAVTVTFPVANVNAFPVTAVLASAVTTIVPKPNDTCEPVRLTLALPLIVKVPRPNASQFGSGSSTIESAIIPTLPIVIVSAFFVTFTFTEPMFVDVANGNADIASNPKLINNP